MVLYMSTLKIREFLDKRVIPQVAIDRPVGYSRQPIYVDPQNLNASTNSNSKISFQINSDVMYDFSRCSLRFNASATRVGGTYVRFSSPISTVIDKVIVKIGGVVVEELLDYGLLDSIISNQSASNSFQSTVGYVLMGFADQATRNLWATQGRQYQINLRLASLQQVMFTNLLAERVMIEIYLKSPEECLECDGVGSYLVTNAQIGLDQFIFSEKIDYKSVVMEELMKSGSFQVNFNTYNHDTQTVTGAGSQSLTISAKYKSTKYFMMIMRDTNTVSSQATNNKFSTYNNNGLINYQFRVNGSNYPVNYIDCRGGGVGTVRGTDLYIQQLEVFRSLAPAYGLEETDFALAQNLYVDKTCICYDFTCCDSSLSGINLSTGYSTFTVNFNLGTVATPQSAEIYVWFDRQLIMERSGRVRTDD